MSSLPSRQLTKKKRKAQRKLGDQRKFIPRQGVARIRIKEDVRRKECM